MLIIILKIKRVNNYELMLEMKRRLFLFLLCRKFTLIESVNLLIININNEFNLCLFSYYFKRYCTLNFLYKK